MEPQFKAALPEHISSEKFTRVVMTAITSNPELVNADRTTLFSSCLKAASDGLLPDGKEAALIVFKTKNGPIVQYLPMIGGILKKIRNSGELSSITAQLVYENDAFDYMVDADGEHLQHKPNMFGDRGNLKGAYALAKTKDGAVYIEVMTMAQLDAVKNVSRSKEYGPWAGAFQTEMMKKTVMRRLSKRLPMSTDLEQVIQRDDDLYDVSEIPAIAQPKQQGIPSRLKANILPPQEAPAEVSVDVKPEEQV